MGLLEIAKVTTIIEIVLSCNYFLGFEIYGLFERKSIWVIIGMIYRGILIIIYTSVGLSILAIADGVETHVETQQNRWSDSGYSNEANDVVSTVRYFNFCMFTA